MSERPLHESLGRLRREIRRLALAYGISRVLCAASSALLLLYLLDRWLVLPAAVRLLLLLVTATGVSAVAWRDLIRPWRVRLTAEDVARAIERRFGEFDGRLLTTLELERRGERDPGFASLLDELERRTGEILARIDLRRMLRPRAPLVWAAAAGALLLVEGSFAVTSPELARIFAERLVGGDARWPRRVVLTVTFPDHGEFYRVERSSGGTPRMVRIAAGASLPVVVRAAGETPHFVELEARWETGGRTSVPLTPTPRGEWVGRFKNVQASFTFHAHDGDPNDDSEPVEVEVVPAPVVREVETELRFPAYTRLEPRVEPRGDVEAPVGTRVVVRVRAEGGAEGGWLEFEQEGGRRPLEVGEEGRLEADFVVRRSTSYAARLLGAAGFPNLDRPTFAVVAVPDRAPTVRVLEPARASVEVTPRGVLPFRVAADDDFGLTSLSLVVEAGEEPFVEEWVEPGAQPQRLVVVHPLDLAEVKLDDGSDSARPPQVGDSFGYRIVAVDGRTAVEEEGAQAGKGSEAADGPNRTEVNGRRFDVVSVNELLRLLTERQLRLKEDVRKLREFQAAKMEKVREWLSDLEASEGEELPAPEGLSAAEIGQAQVTTRSTRLCADFSQMFERYLFNRLDGSAAAERLIPFVLDQKRRSEQLDAFDFELWQRVRQQYESGTFGRLDVLGRLLGMLGVVLDIAAVDSPAATEAVSRARLADDVRERAEALQEAFVRQTRIVERLDELLERMDEWEDFQEIVTLMRDLLDDQRDLHARTRAALGGR